MIIGIGGYRGVGKSSVVSFMTGFVHVDEKLLRKKLYSYENDGYRQIYNYFGEEFFTSKGVLKEKKLENFIGKDFLKMRILNNIIDPLLINEAQKEIDRVGRERNIVIEADNIQKYQSLLDFMIWVDAPVLCEYAKQQKYLFSHCAKFKLILSNDFDLKKLERVFIKEFEKYQ
ncbi:dephospho-CoA kinase [Candidatus Peregrinibacteria bacterium]|nr:dephospho-CoA kinase [Candidatus Peregrinibacteria bacterium]